MFNLKGDIIGNFRIGIKIQCLDSYTISPKQKKDVLLVAALKNKISLFKLVEGLKTDIIEIPSKTIPPKPHLSVSKEERVIKAQKSIPSDTSADTTAVSAKQDIKSQDIRVLRGGQIEGGEYLFKINFRLLLTHRCLSQNVHAFSAVVAKATLAESAGVVSLKNRLR